MRFSKSFSFWLTSLAIAICLFNLSGYDDKNILLFMTNPILLLLADYSSFMRRFLSEGLLLALFYFLHVFVWCWIGMMIDAIVHSSLRRRLNAYLKKTGILSVVVICIAVLFYQYQNSETKMGMILKHPDQYNAQSIQIAVVKSAKEGYGQHYIDEMENIVQTTKSGEVYNSTIYALGIIGTPDSIKVIVDNHNGNEFGHALLMNEQTIITMLDVSQPRHIIHAGIRASELLGFRSFIQPLSAIANQYPDEEVREFAAKVLQQISQNPKENNPKFNED